MSKINSKAFIIAITLLLSFSASFGQLKIELSGGKSFSNFIYNDGEGNTELYNYHLGGVFQIGVYKEANNNNFGGSIGTYKGGAKADSEFDYWDLNYAYLEGRYMRMFKLTDGLSLSAGAFVNYNHLLKGKQVLNDTQIDIIENDVFKRFDVQVGPYAGVNLFINESLSLNLNYKYAYGINQIEKIDAAEKTHNMSHLLLAGISLNI